jgi:hypothetical protein
MNIPCVDCITLSICKSQALADNQDRAGENLIAMTELEDKCTLLSDYTLDGLDNSTLDYLQYCRRQRRVLAYLLCGVIK